MKVHEGATPRFPYPPRRGQLEAAEALAEEVRRGGVFILRAPTGFGKTAAIIHGLLLAGAKRVLYVVRTRNELVPVIRELRRFGVDDYVFLYSARRMCPLLRGRGLGLTEFWEMCRLLRLRGACSYYERLGDLAEDEVRRLIRGVGSPFAAVDALAIAGFCPFFALQALVPGARFVVATYPYLFRRDIFEAVFTPLDYEDFVVVVDEAHSLLFPGSLGEVSLTARDIERAAEEARSLGYSGLSERLQELLGLLETTARSAGLRRLNAERLRRTLGDLELWSSAAYEARLRRLKEALERGGEPAASALGKVEELVAALHTDGYGVYARSDPSPGIVALPLDPCIMAAEPLGRAAAVVLASGTFPSEALLRDALCLGERRLTYYDVEIIHGYSVPGRRLVVALTEVTSRYSSRAASMYRLYAEYIALTAEVAERHILVVYPSYEFMSSVTAALEGLLDRERLYVESKGEDLDGLARLAATRSRLVINAVAGGKLTEGIELVDEEGRSLISVVFVAGVPYPQPDDYLRDQLARLSARLGPRAARHLLFDAAAAVKTRQAVGRAQRGRGEDALVVLADHRWLRPRLLRELRLDIDATVGSLDEYKAILERARSRIRF